MKFHCKYIEAEVDRNDCDLCDQKKDCAKDGYLNEIDKKYGFSFGLAKLVPSQEFDQVMENLKGWGINVDLVLKIIEDNVRELEKDKIAVIEERMDRSYMQQKRQVKEGKTRRIYIRPRKIEKKVEAERSLLRLTHYTFVNDIICHIVGYTRTLFDYKESSEVVFSKPGPIERQVYFTIADLFIHTLPEDIFNKVFDKLTIYYRLVERIRSRWNDNNEAYYRGRKKTKKKDIPYGSLTYRP